MVEEVATMLCRFSLRLLIALLALSPQAFAHRLDEYLQATIVSIEPGHMRLQINLTPGVAVAEQVLAQVDRDRDSVITKREADAYAEWLKGDLIVRLDQQLVELKTTSSSFPEFSDLRTGFGIIQIEFVVLAPFPLALGTHRLTLENRHLSKVSVYLFNAAKPESNSILINAQKRNANQSTGEIEFTLNAPSRVHSEATDLHSSHSRGLSGNHDRSR